MQPYPPPPPPPGGNRRWIPAAIIAAGIVIAGALIGAAVMLSNRDKGAGPAASSAAATEASSTCQAWKTTRTARQRTPSERAAIQKLYEAGVNMTEIARRFDCSRDTVVRIVRGRTFRSKQQ